jgi:hypothetical protein
MKALDGGKLYVGLLAVVLLMAAFYFIKATTAKPVSQEMIEQQEQAIQEQSNTARETALEWSACFFSTTKGADAWISAISPITSEEYLKELEGAMRGQLKSGDEMLNQTRSYLEAGQEQNVKISVAGIYQQEEAWRVSLLAQAYYTDASVDISMEIALSPEGEDLKVQRVCFQQLGD